MLLVEKYRPPAAEVAGERNFVSLLGECVLVLFARPGFSFVGVQRWYTLQAAVVPAATGKSIRTNARSHIYCHTRNVPGTIS